MRLETVKIMLKACATNGDIAGDQSMVPIRKLQGWWYLVTPGAAEATGGGWGRDPKPITTWDMWISSVDLPFSKPILLWKIWPIDRLYRIIYPSKMVMSNSYVSLPEGTYLEPGSAMRSYTHHLWTCANLSGDLVIWRGHISWQFQTFLGAESTHQPQSYGQHTQLSMLDTLW